MDIEKQAMNRQETLRVAESDGDYNLLGILEIKAAVDAALKRRGLDVEYNPHLGLYRGGSKKSRKNNE